MNFKKKMLLLLPFAGSALCAAQPSEIEQEPAQKMATQKIRKVRGSFKLLDGDPTEKLARLNKKIENLEKEIEKLNRQKEVLLVNKEITDPAPLVLTNVKRINVARTSTTDGRLRTLIL